MAVLIFMGPPGSGKGTQALKLSERLKIPHIALGDILREEVAAGTDVGKQAEKFMSAGKLVPDELTIDIIRERLKKSDCRDGFILDGFPRNGNQAKNLEKIFSDLNVGLDRAVYFSIPLSDVVKRLSERRSCKKCGAVYHLTFHPPKKKGICDRCGEELYQRHDDEEAIIKTRFSVYTDETKPLI
ncbi:MAG: adenylate kinase, partial [Candidatus Saganbacteria bacterium]|nr:adenylate kinase [Candidatus Saganbacteria bacterium]